jgi:putative DeoR family transcriptional regulator (stage III sporulation protein D)
VETGCTVRACSAHFGISKSTVHKDVSERLKFIDTELFEEVRQVLDKNLSERHIRGGNATKQKYEIKIKNS